jgi:hypothetical protein
VVDRFTTGGSTQDLAQWRALTGQDIHSLIATAAQLFVNPIAFGGDYHLRLTSPAINAGTSMFAPALDLDGRARPIGAAFDIGAYEWGTAAIPGDFNSDGRVDGADYVVWRKTNGTPAAFQIWRANFGDTSGLGSSNAIAIPEPQATALLCLGWLLAAAARRATPIPAPTRVRAIPLRAG